MKIPNYQQDVKELMNQLEGMIPEDKMAVFNRDASLLAEKYGSALKLSQGDKAPSFSLPNVKGNFLSSEELLSSGPMVLTFYRGIWCPYCNLQLKNYQQILPQINSMGANLVAVSPMTPDNSMGMKETNELQFEVLSDIGNQVARLFTTVFKNADAPIQAMSEMGYDFNSFYDDSSAELPVPATFVIGQNSTVLYAGSAGGDYRNRVEAQDILDALAI